MSKPKTSNGNGNGAPRHPSISELKEIWALERELEELQQKGAELVSKKARLVRELATVCHAPPGVGLNITLAKWCMPPQAQGQTPQPIDWAAWAGNSSASSDWG